MIYECRWIDKENITMAKYRKKPVVINAIQYDGKNGTDVLRFMFPDIEPDAEANVETIKIRKG